MLRYRQSSLISRTGRDPLFGAYLVEDLSFQFFGEWITDWPRFKLYTLDPNLPSSEPFNTYYGDPLGAGWLKTDDADGHFPDTVSVDIGYQESDFPTSGTGFDFIPSTNFASSRSCW